MRIEDRAYGKDKRQSAVGPAFLPVSEWPAGMPALLLPFAFLFFTLATATPQALPVAVRTDTLPDAILGKPYHAVLEAGGGRPPYRWILANGSLPRGLEMDKSTGQIRGTPSTAGTSEFTIRVADSSRPAQTAGRFFKMQVVGALAMLTTNLPEGISGLPYSFPLQAQGGTPPLKWMIAGGALPANLQLNSGTGLLSGTLAVDGQFQFALQVTDSGNPPQKQSRAFVLSVRGPLLIDWKRLPLVDGDKINGSVEVSNSTRDDFDLTVIVVAVNEYGKAFTLGYQHLQLQKGVTGQEIPFGSSLPRGNYVVHADAVAEVNSRGAIYRSRRQQGPLRLE